MEINIEQFQKVNSQRPLTSYGGISARQKSLKNSLSKKSFKENHYTEATKFEELFPESNNFQFDI
jgi:hypothetical protein